MIFWLVAMSTVAAETTPFPLPRYDSSAITEKTCTLLLGNLGRNSGSDYKVKILRESPRFKKFLAEKGFSELTSYPPEKRKSIEVQFLREELTRLNENLPALQSARLRDELAVRGAPPTPESDGYQRLRIVSSENRKRLTPTGLEAAKAALPVEAREAIAELGLSLYHNAHLPPRPDEISHLLSSHQLDALGLDGGYNTQPFNRDLIRSGDNCFFNVSIGLRGGVGELTSRYGPHGLTPEDAYARERGWISHYVMWPNELLELVSYADPALYAKITELVAKEFPEDAKRIANDMKKDKVAAPSRAAGRWLPPSRVGDGIATQLLDKHPEIAAAAVRLQHLYDFTPQDFNGLMQDRTAVRLAELYRTDRKAYAEALSLVKRGGIHDLTKDDTIPNHFEFKIPVGIPTQAIGRTW